MKRVVIDGETYAYAHFVLELGKPWTKRGLLYWPASTAEGPVLWMCSEEAGRLAYARTADVMGLNNVVVLPGSRKAP